MTLLGNCGQQPELKFTPSGTPVATFSLAVNHKFKDSKTGEMKEGVDWLYVVVWNKTAEFAAKNFIKGDAIFVKGRLSNRSWTTVEGEKRQRTEVIAMQVIPLNKKPINGTDTQTNSTDNLEEAFDIP